MLDFWGELSTGLGLLLDFVSMYDIMIVYDILVVADRWSREA